jgi:hypothetical protein
VNEEIRQIKEKMEEEKRM